MGTAKDVEAAVEAARKIFPSWASTPPVRRARVMFKFLELVRRDKEKLAEVITSEHGKVFRKGRSLPMRVVRWSAVSRW